MSKVYWADELISSLDKTVKHRVDDMKTPSGHAHAGSMRAIATHALVYEAMKHAQYNVDFTYVINDMDPMDGMPVYLDKNKYDQHMGKPLYMIPAPDGKSESYAMQYATEYIEAFNKLGFNPTIFRSSKLYESGAMDKWISLALNSVETIRTIYLEVAKQEKPKNWYPLQVVCPSCGKVGSSLVTDWDGTEVVFECKKDLVSWAVGCGHKGKISPFGGVAKLMWKVDWPAHWAELGITVEGAGKDHLSAGGSHEIAVEIMRKVFDQKPPFSFLHEFFLIGGAKMSSSKGNATTAEQLVHIIPPELVRFLFVRTPYKKAFNFNPAIKDTIPDLFDEYDACAISWYENKDSTKEGRMYAASQLTLPSKEKLFLPRFRVVVQLAQGTIEDPVDYFARQKGSNLSGEEVKILNERLLYAKLWLKQYGKSNLSIEEPNKIINLDKELDSQQKDFLSNLSHKLDSVSFNSVDEVQVWLFDFVKENNIESKKAFVSIYLTLLGKKYGPKAGLLIYEFLQKDKKELMQKLAVTASSDTQSKYTLPVINDKKLFSISRQVKTTWPSICIGFAEIKNVTVVDSNLDLEVEKKKLLESLEDLTLDDISNNETIVSYRKLYKDFGTDWHSRRPSPEALIRRVVQGKGLYSINTAVDASNLIVLQNFVSAGVFDLDKIQYPTMLDVAKGNEKILLHGEQEPKAIKAGELCYFDNEGPYNLDFNYRDAVRTTVTTQTKNILINVDGVYTISRTMVESTLNNLVDKIVQYCGGTVSNLGIVE